VTSGSVKHDRALLGWGRCGATASLWHQSPVLASAGTRGTCRLDVQGLPEIQAARLAPTELSRRVTKNEAAPTLPSGSSAAAFRPATA